MVAFADKNNQTGILELSSLYKHDNYDYVYDLRQKAEKALSTALGEKEYHVAGALKNAALAALAGLGALPTTLGMTEIGQNVTDYYNNIAENSPDVNEFRQAQAEDRESIWTMALGTSGPTAVAAGMSLIPYVGIPMASAYFFHLNQDEVEQMALSKGADPATAKMTGYIGGAVNSALDMIPLSSYVNKNPFTKKLVDNFKHRLVGAGLKLMVDGGLEGLTEGTQQLVSEIFSEYAASKDTGEFLNKVNNPEWWDKVNKDIVKSATIGGIMGLGFGGVSAGASSMMDRTGAQPTPPPLNDQEKANLINIARQEFENGNITPDALNEIKNIHPDLSNDIDDIINSKIIDEINQTGDINVINKYSPAQASAEVFIDQLSGEDALRQSPQGADLLRGQLQQEQEESLLRNVKPEWFSPAQISAMAFEDQALRDDAAARSPQAREALFQKFANEERALGPAKDYGDNGYNITQVKDSENDKNTLWKIDIKPDFRMAIGGLIDEVQMGQPGGRMQVDQNEWIGYSSSYPTFMQNKGWTGNDVINALKKAQKGEALGYRQASMVESAIDYLNELEYNALKEELLNEYSEEDIRRAEEEADSLINQQAQAFEVSPEELTALFEFKAGQDGIINDVPDLKTTGEAVEFSKIATPKQLEKAAQLSEKWGKEGQRLLAENKFNEAIAASTKSQLYREVGEAKAEPERFEIKKVIQKAQERKEPTPADEVKPEEKGGAEPWKETSVKEKVKAEEKESKPLASPKTEEKPVQPTELTESGGIWNLKTTDMSYYDGMIKNPEYYKKNKGVEGKIEWMTPKEYLDKQAKAKGVDPQKDIANSSIDKIRNYTWDMKDGKKFPMLVIEAHKKLQEGKHRALAAMQAGIEKVPVLIVTPINNFKKENIERKFITASVDEELKKEKDKTPSSTQDTAVEGKGEEKPAEEKPAGEKKYSIKDVKGEERNPFKNSVIQNVVYHGTIHDFNEFNREYISSDLGFHFGTIAQANDRLFTEDFPKKQWKILKNYINLTNPLRLNDIGDWTNPNLLGNELVKKKIISTKQYDTFKKEIYNDNYNDSKIHKLTPKVGKYEKEPHFKFWEYKSDNDKKILWKKFKQTDKKIVNRYLALIKNKGYDGIIYKNKTEAPSFPADSYIVFNSDQIKLFPNQPSSPEIGEPSTSKPAEEKPAGEKKYSIKDVKGKKEEPKNLVVIHNLTAEKLKHADRMGGLAVPSIAVTGKDAPMQGFGDISLIMTPDILEQRETKTFNADIYSPRYPSITYDIQLSQKLIDEISPLAKEFGTSPDSIFSDLGNRGLKDLYNDDVIKYQFLKDNNISIGVAENASAREKRDIVYSKVQGMQDKFRSWVNDKYASIIKGEKIFTGFTPSGNRRYLPHNLDNVVKLMKKKLRDGEGFNYGVPSIRSTVAKQFKTIKSIQKDRDKIISEEAMEKVKEETNKEFEGLVENDFKPYIDYKCGFGNYDAISDHFKESVTRGFNYVNKEYYNGDLPLESMQKAADFLNKLRNLPTEYFEGKIQRAVGLNEFTSAVVPEGTDQKTIDVLNKNGITDIVYYKKNDDADRARAIDSIQNKKVFFSITDKQKQLFSQVGYNEIKKVFPGSKVAPLPSIEMPNKKGFLVTMPNGRKFILDPTLDKISVDTEAAAKEYKISKSQMESWLNSTGQVKGATSMINKTMGFIELINTAGPDTLTHEKLHMIIMMGGLSSANVDKIIKRYGTEEKAAEAFRRREGFTEGLWDKIKGWLDKLRSALFGDVFDAVDMAMQGEMQGEARGGRNYEISAWHGGPHKFDRFTTEKIGTGEGAQAFGWGLYFTDLENIGKYYAETLAEPGKAAITYKGENITTSNISTDTKIIIIDIANSMKLGNSVEDAKIGIKKRYQKDYENAINNPIYKSVASKFKDKLNILESLDSDITVSADKNRNLYKVTLHKGKEPGQYTWLDWDKALSQEIKDKVINQIKKETTETAEISNLKKELKETESIFYDGINKVGEKKWNENTEKAGEIRRKLYDLTGDAFGDSKLKSSGVYANIDKVQNGERLYKYLHVDLGSAKEASLFLLRAGIDGVRYPAGSLSGVESDAKNYVVFDENAITIEEHKQYQIKDEHSGLLQDINGKMDKVSNALSIGTWKNKKKDLRPIVDVLLSTPLHSYDRIPTMGRLFDTANEKVDINNEVLDSLTRNPETDEVYTRIIELSKKNDPEMYKKWTDYRVNQDKNQIGYKIRFNPETGKHDLYAPDELLAGEYDSYVKALKASMASDTPTWVVKTGDKYSLYKSQDKPVASYDSDAEALKYSRLFEAKEFMKKYGASEEMMKTFLAEKTMLDNGFNVQMQAMRDLIKYYKENDLPMPSTPVTMEGETVQVNLEMALAMMGDRRGYYFPRIRNQGQFMLSAKKGNKKWMDFYDMGAEITEDKSRGTLLKQVLNSVSPMGKKARELRNQGYEVTIEKAERTPEEVFVEQTRRIINLQTEINDALKAVKKGKVSFESLGFEVEKYKGKNKKGNDVEFLTLDGNTNKQQREMFKEFGGEYYAAQKGEKEAWHFRNPGKTFESRLLKALATVSNNVELETVNMFAQELIDSLATMEKGRGARSHMISRDTSRGDDVWEGYETDPLIAASKYVAGIAGSEAKKIMSGKLMRQFFGIDITWKEFKAAKSFEGSYGEFVEDQQKQGNKVVISETEYADINDPEGYIENQKELALLKEQIANAADGEDIAELVDKKQEAYDWLYSQYRDMVDERRIDSQEQTVAWKDGKSFIENMIRNDESVDRIMGFFKGLAVLKYLAGRVSAPIINLTALATSAPGAMNAFGDIPITTSLNLIQKYARKYGQYMLTKNGRDNMTEDEQWVFDQIKAKGWDSAAFNREALTALETKTGKAWRRMIELSMLGFGVTEQLNRASTIAGAYFGLMETKPDMSKTERLKLAKDISDKAHGVYNKSNMPAWARGSGIAGNLARSFYVFKTFSHNYLQTMAKAWGPGWTPEHAKAFSFMALAPAVLGGAGAIVGKEVIIQFAKALGLGGDDPEEEFYKFVADNFGETSEDVARFGLAGLAGINLKGSLEIGITDLPTTIQDFMGAPGSIVKDIYEGGVNISKGNIIKGLENIMPLAIANPIKGIREATEGLTTKANAPIFYGKKPIIADTVDALLRVFSFNPAELSEIREKQWSEKQIEQKYTERRAEIYSRARKYMLQPYEKRNESDWVEIIDQIQKYNDRLKESGYNYIPKITSKSLKNNLRRALRPSKKERMREMED